SADTKTKTNYIDINTANSCFHCDTLNLPPPGSLTLYGSSQGGYLIGTNGYGDNGFANKFETGDYAPFTDLTGVLIYLYSVDDGGNNATVDVNVWDNTGTGGSPGTLLQSKTYSLSDLASALAADP